MRLLVVEDDAELRGALDRRLRNSGFGVDAVADIPEAEFALSVNSYDALVLDRAVASGDTIDLVRRARSGGNLVPVLFLTAKDAVASRVEGFEVGGDDYLVKPFAMAELIARTRRLCRYRPGAAPATLRVADLVVDLSRAEVRRAGVLLTLTPKEFSVLAHLAARPGSVVSRSDLIEACWDEVSDPASNTVDVHIASLRRKLGAPALIHTLRSLGYRLE